MVAFAARPEKAEKARRGRWRKLLFPDDLRIKKGSGIYLLNVKSVLYFPTSTPCRRKPARPAGTDNWGANTRENACLPDLNSGP